MMNAYIFLITALYLIKTISGSGTSASATNLTIICMKNCEGLIDPTKAVTMYLRCENKDDHRVCDEFKYLWSMVKDPKNKRQELTKRDVVGMQNLMLLIKKNTLYRGEIYTLVCTITDKNGKSVNRTKKLTVRNGHTTETTTSTTTTKITTTTTATTTKKPKDIFDDFIGENGELSEELLRENKLLNTTGKNSAEIILDIETAIRGFANLKPSNQSQKQVKKIKFAVQKQLMVSLLQAPEEPQQINTKVQTINKIMYISQQDISPSVVNEAASLIDNLLGTEFKNINNSKPTEGLVE